MGGVSRQTYAATFPPDHFYCLLDELPLHLIPRRFRRSLRTEGERPLYLNPECTLCPADRAPDEVADGLLSRFALQGTMAWVREAECGSLLPFWLGQKYEEFVCGLQAEEEVPLTVPASARNILAAARIFVGGDDRGEALGKAAARFQEKGYVPLGDLIHPFHVAALRRYYRYLIRTGEITLETTRAHGGMWRYNESGGAVLSSSMGKKLSVVAGSS